MAQAEGPIQEPIIFVHIPKTAGTSLRQVVTEVYADEGCLLIYEPGFSDDPALSGPTRENAQRVRAVYGHFSFGAHEGLGLQPRYVTVLREPVARVMSFFRHLVRDEDSEFHDRIAAGMTLVELLRSGECHQVNNHMCRILSGRHTDDLVFDRDYLDLALANLDAYFLAVGIAEDLERSVRRIGQVLGWDHVPAVPRLNVDPDPPQGPIPDDVRAEILHFNALDQELYRVMAARFLDG